MTKPRRLNCGSTTELQNDSFILRLFFARCVHTDNEHTNTKEHEKGERTKNEIKTLQQYLYMGKDHNVVFHNSLDVPLRLWFNHLLRKCIYGVTFIAI